MMIHESLGKAYDDGYRGGMAAGFWLRVTVSFAVAGALCLGMGLVVGL